MKAITITEFQGVADGEVYPKTFKVDDPVFGELAKVAVKEKWAKEVKDEAAAPAKKEISVDDMTTDEMIAHATAKKIDLKGATKRDEILKAIKAAPAKT